MRFLLSLLSLLALVPLTGFAQEKKLDAKGIEFFETKIRPVLVEKCYQCHSQEAQKNKKLRGDLYLDSRAGLLKGGATGPVVVPGKSSESLLFRALRQDGDLKMPPKGKLADAVIADFAKWIDMGAPDPRDGQAVAAKGIDIEAARKSWAFSPLVAPAIPKVANAAWGKTPLDRFILAKLEEKKLTPNNPVSREKLLRRVYFDLLGMPPSPAEIDAFLKDAAADAYERLIDRLLASEHYGERWARHWLDLVRYAESGGYEFDRDRPGAFHYRDFVIKALNQGMPYDQFVRLQVAGDHLIPDDFMATSATGFLASGPFPGQTTSKTQELIRYNHLDDMLATLGSSMLGLSVGCARCHAHKYDPIPQEDYYRLLACLARTDAADLKMDPNPEPYRKAKAAYDVAHAPFLAAREKFEKEQLQGLIQKWLKGAKEKPATDWVLVEDTKVQATNQASSAPKGKESGTTYTGRSYLKDITRIRLEADGILRGFTVTSMPVDGKAKPTAVKLRGLPVIPNRNNYLFIEIDGTIGSESGLDLTFQVSFKDKLVPFQVAITTAARPIKWNEAALPQSLGEILALMEKDKGQLTAKNRAGVLYWLRKLEPEADKIYKAEEEHAKNEPKPNLIPIFAATSGKGGDVYFLNRGEVEKKGPKSEPGFLQVLMKAPELEKRWTGKADPKQPESPRLALARWLTDTDNGAGNLLARVIVNRLWQHHLGRGIVATANDFGAQGEPPTHPELLDYLASELVRNGWKLKPIHKLIVTSAVYMEDGAVTATNQQIDPTNRLWWRHPARRLEAETIRDALLAVSGTLDKTMYGAGTLDVNNPRRSIYLTVKRSQMVPLMQMFDAPEAIQSIGERTTTTVATQSLAFLNSPLVRQRAEKFAARVRPKTIEEMPSAIDEAYRIALSRRASAVERERMLAFMQSQMTSYGQTPRALDQALTDVCQVILCLNEFVYVD